MSTIARTWVPKTYNRATEPDVPSWCPTCGYAIANNLDAKSFVDYGCCHTCEGDIVGPNFLAWKEGWRPDAIYLQARLTERKETARRRYYLK